MDNCWICRREIETGTQYIISKREIRHGDKSWYATDHRHYALCSDCDAWIRGIIEEEKEAHDF